MTEKTYLLTADQKIGLNIVKRIYQKTSKCRESLGITISASKGRLRERVQENQILLTITHNPPKNKKEKRSLEALMKKIRQRGDIQFITEKEQTSSA